MSIFDHDLDRTAANHVPLSPISFLIRAAHVYGPRVAVGHGERRITYAQFLDRSRRLASALARAGVGKGYPAKSWHLLLGCLTDLGVQRGNGHPEGPVRLPDGHLAETGC